MKTTLELPDELFREIKLRSVMDGRKLKETVADLLRAGLSQRKAARHPLLPMPRTLPVAPVKPADAANPGLSPEQLNDLIRQADLDLEIERYEKAS